VVADSTVDFPGDYMFKSVSEVSKYSGREYFCGYNYLKTQGLGLEIGRDGKGY